MLALTAVPAVQAQTDYRIDSFTIDGGGGTSTGGIYAVTGTIGQSDAGTMGGGRFVLTGGFWSLIAAIQTPGAPLLRIHPANGSIMVAWPWPSTGWILQQTTNLNTPNWVTAPEVPANDDTIRWILLTPATGNRFYRLHKP